MFLDKYDPLKKQMVRILDPEGNCNDELVPKDLTPEKIKDLYEKMVFIRMCDTRLVKMQRSGRMGTVASVEGQEAAQVGSAAALEPKDWMTVSFREHAAAYTHGVPMEKLFLFWKGNEAGGHYPEGVNVLPPSVPVGSQMLHAVGIGFASKLRKESQIAITYFGDGATSEGDFHEAMNLAGVYKTPTIFLCQNNQWAISVPRKSQTASETLAQKAIAYGFPGVQVDGNDLLAMYSVTKEAAERARKGEGPTLIEAVTYRIGDHTTSDDARKYRDPTEIEPWKPKDPILRVQKYLLAHNLWSKEYAEQLVAKFQQEVDAITAKVEAEPDQTIDDIFAYNYAEPTPEQIEQREYLKKIEAIRAAQKQQEQQKGGSNA